MNFAEFMSGSLSTRLLIVRRAICISCVFFFTNRRLNGSFPFPTATERRSLEPFLSRGAHELAGQFMSVQ